MKKILITLLLSLCILFVGFSSVTAETAETVNLGIKISETDAGFKVEVPDSDLYDDLKPTISVITDLDAAQVTNGSVVVPCTVTDGKVSFQITEGGTYIIARPVKPSGYVAPKTGIN